MYLSFRFISSRCTDFPTTAIPYTGSLYISFAAFSFRPPISARLFPCVSRRLLFTSASAFSWLVHEDTIRSNKRHEWIYIFVWRISPSCRKLNDRLPQQIWFSTPWIFRNFLSTRIFKRDHTSRLCLWLHLCGFYKPYLCWRYQGTPLEFCLVCVHLSS